MAEYSVMDKQRDMKKISKGLFKSKGGPSKEIKLDDLIRDMDTCPFCGSEAVIKEIEAIEGETGKKKKITVKIPRLIVDRKTQTYVTKGCCNQRGAAISYIMQTKCKGKTTDDKGKPSTVEREAIRWLLDWIK